MLKTYLINLDKNKDRRLAMDAQLTRLGLEYERVSAVYGKNLSKLELKRDFSAFRSFLAMGVPLTAGEIGCALSHGQIYSRMSELHEPCALILEDDVVLEDGFAEVLASVKRFVDVTRPQVVVFSDFPGTKNAPKEGISALNWASCTDAYLITLPAAQLIYKVNYPVVTVADRWGRWHKRFGVELYRVFPTTARQDNNRFGTDIGTWTMPGQNKTRNMTCFRMLSHKFCRVFELSVDWLLWKVTGR